MKDYLLLNSVRKMRYDMPAKINADKIMDWYGYVRQLTPSLIRRPLGYFLYITGRCNLSCDFCWQREMPDRESKNTKTHESELTGKEWIQVIKSIPRFSFVGLTGGEPLLHPGFMDMVRFLGGRFSYTINTNGLLLNNETIEKLIKYKATNLSISIDGFANVHDIARKSTGLFNHIVAMIEQLNVIKKKRGTIKPSLTIKTVLLDQFLDQLNEFYRFCDETLKADCLNISIMKTTRHAQYDFRVYEDLKDIKDIGEPACYHYNQEEKIPQALASLLEYSKRRHCRVLLYPRTYKQSSIEYLFQHQGRGVFGSCYIPWTLVVILADGTVIPCLSLNMANIRRLDYDVRRINRLRKYQNFLKWRSAMNRAKKSPPECNMCCFSAVKVK